jgi:ArsR family transcriptional regulator
MHDDALTRALAALGHPIRMALYRRLIAAGAEGRGPVALAAEEDMQRTLVGYHLQPLVAAGLVRSERRGRDVNYQVVPTGMNRLAAELLTPEADPER